MKKPLYTDLFVHGINFVLCMADMNLGRITYHLKHTVCFFVYVLTYLIWTILHFHLKVGNYQPCDRMRAYKDKNYKREECPIYNALDWHNAVAAGILCAVVALCVVPLCQLPLWWCVYSRRTADAFHAKAQVQLTPPVSPALAQKAVQGQNTAAESHDQSFQRTCGD